MTFFLVSNKTKTHTFCSSEKTMNDVQWFMGVFCGRFEWRWNISTFIWLSLSLCLYRIAINIGIFNGNVSKLPITSSLLFEIPKENAIRQMRNVCLIICQHLTRVNAIHFIDWTHYLVCFSFCAEREEKKVRVTIGTCAVYLSRRPRLIQVIKFL